LWVTSLKPVLLIAVLFYRVGTELKLSRRLAALAAVYAVMLAHYWIANAGASSLKNDTIHSCGVVLLALGGLRVVRGAVDRESGVLLAGGIIFATVKFSGVPESVAALGLTAMFGALRLWPRRRAVAAWAAWAALGWALTSGQFYLYNTLKYHN